MFQSFFLAGFECATGYNVLGEWIDQIAATHHDKHADEDYARLREFGFYAAREGVRWPLVDKGGRYDFESVQPFIEASQKHGITIIWDLFHYGYPKELDLLSDDFVKRFAEYCHATAEYMSRHFDGDYYFTPVNEPSYFSWAAGEVGRFAPHHFGKGYELKVALARAGIQGINAIRSVLPRARMVNVDPVCWVLPPDNKPESIEAARYFNDVAVFESWDMLSGRLLPELGGSRAHLDIVGINYYWTNQWILGRDEHPLDDDDSRRVPLRQLVRNVWERYGGDLLITETSHVDGMRPKWLRYLANECEALLTGGVPLRGVCLYPILGMPEWHAQSQWTCMGLWDLAFQDGSLRREICQQMHEALRVAQELELHPAWRLNRELPLVDAALREELMAERAGDYLLEARPGGQGGAGSVRSGESSSIR